MGYIKCPRCELNYMLDGEEYCDICKAQIGYRKPIAQREIEHIYEYVCRIYDDFRQYVDTSDTLCDLKSITFESNCLPKYSNVHVQQLYLLRYAYAYAYEYKSMYQELFKSYSFGSNIAVTSIGCGNMIDYWSLEEALHENGKDDIEINYIGLDVIDWQYKVKTRAKDNVEFKQVDAVKYLSEVNQLDSDVYFFPKSISEFSNYDFIKLCDCFKNKSILKDKFCLLVSIRPVDIWGRKDIDRVVELVKAIVSNGFVTDDDTDTYYSDDRADWQITYLDPQFNYPVGIIDTLKNLTSRCVMGNTTQPDCVKCDKINRSPMLKASYVQYQIFTFYREK